MTESIKNLHDFSQEEEQPRKGGLSPVSIAVIVGLVVAAIIVGMQLRQQNQTQPTDGMAPNFDFTTFDGESYSLSDFRGQVVVINFWASWCVPCAAEAPALESTWQKYKDDGVVFLGIAYADNGPRSLEFMERHGITYMNAPDLGTRISEAYHIQGVPETFIIDRDGSVAEFIYAGVNEQRLSASIEPLLNQ